MNGASVVRDVSDDGVFARRALRSARAGIVSLALAALTAATFGPWFERWTATALSLAALLVSGVGIFWGYRASQDRGQRDSRDGRTLRIGAALCIAGASSSLYLLGALSVMTIPVLSIAVAAFVTLLVSRVGEPSGQGVVE